MLVTLSFLLRGDIGDVTTLCTYKCPKVYSGHKGTHMESLPQTICCPVGALLLIGLPKNDETGRLSQASSFVRFERDIQKQAEDKRRG